MNDNSSIALIGEVCIDYTLMNQGAINKLRFGGVVHPLRAVWAVGEKADIYYISPDYCDDQFVTYSSKFCGDLLTKIGTVVGSPNIVCISEPKEIGFQGYEFLLRDEHSIKFIDRGLRALSQNNYIKDAIIFAGDFSLKPILQSCHKNGSQIHIDLGNYVGDVCLLNEFSQEIKTTFLSTSSPLFHDVFHKSVEEARETILQFSEIFIFKENRGGGRLFSKKSPGPIHYGAQLRSIMHSVGVGDCFDLAYVLMNRQFDQQTSLSYASWIAAEYASTTYPDDFYKSVQQVLKIPPQIITELEGVNFPWEDREHNSIYIAAPDFDFLDRTLITEVSEKLKYHNFYPRLPIRENGQMEANALPKRKEELFLKDIELIHKSSLVLSILLNHDPGTYIEIGYAKAKNIPVIVYNPYKITENLMVTQLPDYISDDLDKIMSKVFEILSRKVVK